MPKTILGIGTKYLGQDHLKLERGLCPHCKREADLSSYDTRLWVVIFYLPVFPLGQKRVIDLCPLCAGHTALPLEDWRRVGEKVLAEARRDYQRRPGEARVGVRYLAALLEVGKSEETRELLEEMAERFGEEVEVMFLVAATYEKLGESEKAEVYFDRALALDPHHRPSRRAKALGLMAAGRPREAYELLDFMIQGEDQDPEILFLLGLAFQNQAEHPAALEIFELISQNFPAFAEEKRFKRARRFSEKAVGD